MSDGFAIPYAKDAQGRLVDPDNAVKGDSYTCPCCDSTVIFKKGNIISPHFAHSAGSECGETIYHKTAKLFFIQAVKDWRAGKGEPIEIDRLQQHHQWCKERRELNKLLLPDRVVNAVEEYRLPCGFIADVVLLDADGIPVCAIEFYMTHRVDVDKSLLISVPFIEVDAFDYVTGKNRAYIKPIAWKSVKGIKPRCEGCVKAKQRWDEVQRRNEERIKQSNESFRVYVQRQLRDRREYWRARYKIPEHLRGADIIE